MRSWNMGRRGAFAALVLIVAAGCHDSTGLSLEERRDVQNLVEAGDVSAHRARWAEHHLTRYAYDYRITGYFIAYAYHTIHVVVIDDVVASAADMTTGQALSGDLTYLPTIDALFDQATSAAQAGRLSGIKYDPNLDYPSEISVAGVPDASGTEYASGLTPLP